MAEAVPTPSTMALVGLALAWAAYGVLHSALISETATSLLRRRLGNAYRFHRLFFDAVALLTLVPVVAFATALRGGPTFRWEGPLLVPRLALVAAGVALLLAGGRHYSLARFLGVAQLREGDALGLARGGGVDSSGVLGLVRHPWYVAVVLLLWARDVDASRLVTNVVLTLYVLVGTRLEERKLVNELGDAYREYQRRVPMFLPLPRGEARECHAMRPRTLTDEPLRVSPAILGRELASPWRRGLALAIDFALLFPPTLALAVGVAALFLHLGDPQALRAIATLVGGVAEGAPAHHEALRRVAPLLVALEAPGLPREVREAVEGGRLDEAAGALAERRLLITLKLDAHAHETPAPGTVRLPVEALIPKTLQGVCLYGLAAAYFTLFHAGPRGATLGKRLLGIRVARLDGHRLSVPESLERFVGYLHLPGSLGLSLLDLWRDPNRRLPHDRVVHTAVLRLTPDGTKREPEVESDGEPDREPPAGSDAAPAAG